MSEQLCQMINKIPIKDRNKVGTLTAAENLLKKYGKEKSGSIREKENNAFSKNY